MIAGDASPEAAEATSVPQGRVRGLRRRGLEAGLRHVTALSAAASRRSAPAARQGGAAGKRACRDHRRPHRRLVEGGEGEIMIMYIHRVLIDAQSAHLIHINVKTVLYAHVDGSPTNAIYVKYYMKQIKVNAMNSNHLRIPNTDLYARTHACTHALTYITTHTHARTHARARTHTHARD